MDMNFNENRNLDLLLKKFKNEKNIKIKRQLSIDKKRYEQGLLLNVQEKHDGDQIRAESNQQIDESDDLIILDDDDLNVINNESKCATQVQNYFNLTGMHLEEVTDKNEKHKLDDLLSIDQAEFTNKEIKVDQIVIKNEQELLFDSYLGTISGENEEIINKLADQLADSLNLPYIFMSLEEYNKLRETESILSSLKLENNDSIVLYDDVNNEELNVDSNVDGNSNELIQNELNNDYVTVKGDTLIRLLFGDCGESYKNAVERRLSFDIQSKFSRGNNGRILKPVSFYIMKKKLRKLQMENKFKNFKTSINKNEISNGLFNIKTPSTSDSRAIIESTTVQNFNCENEKQIIIDLSVYKFYLYICSLNGTCRVFDLQTNSLMNTIEIKNGAKFIQPIYNESRYTLNVAIGSGINETNLYIYDAKLYNIRCKIDLKSEMRCAFFRYHNFYSGLSSGEVVTINRNFNKVRTICKVTDKKISCMGFALLNQNKLLLVGAYDGKIHVVPTKSRFTKIETLFGHEMAPLSIKCKNEIVFSGSADCHILSHNLETRQLLGRVILDETITSLAIHDNILLCSSFDGLIRCFIIKDHNLDLCQQYYGCDFKARLTCMKIENDLIFYGDDKGNVESLVLNLNKRFECQFQNCSKPFATIHYLLKHILYHHLNYLKQLMHKCEWNTCNKWFNSESIKSHLIEHLQTLV